jgi:hypothetical protein
MKINQLNSALLYFAVLWIRMGFNGDPDSAFYLNADQGPGSQNNGDPDSGQTKKSQKVEFLHE